MGRFYESKTYTFVLDAQLLKGDVELLLLDKKQPLLKLSRQFSSQTIDLGEKTDTICAGNLKNRALAALKVKGKIGRSF